MINIWIVLGILLIHWFADFVVQTDKQAKGKSSSWAFLLSHTFYYSAIWMILGSLFQASGITNLSPGILTIFVIITFVAHTTTDYFTSRLNSKLWAKGDVHNFFVSIGFDQFLHFTQLLLTYYFLTK